MIQRLLLVVLALFSLSIANAEGFPNRVTLNFVGPFQVPAKMVFTHTNSHYELVTTVNIPFKTMKFVSKGDFENNRLIPTFFEDTRGGKPYAKATFDRKNSSIIYGRNGEQLTTAMTGLAQDFFTTAWQATLNKAPLTEKVQTTNGKKVYERAPFKYEGQREEYVNGRKTKVDLYVSGSGDDRVELALSPQDLYLPAMIAYYEKGKRYELNLRSYQVD